jgi:hypothetical protein
LQVFGEGLLRALKYPARDQIYRNSFQRELHAYDFEDIEGVFVGYLKSERLLVQ